MLFGISYAIFRIRRKRDRRASPDSDGSPSAVRVRLNHDPGVQEIYCEKTLMEGVEIRILPVRDAGNQEIEDIESRPG